MLGVVDLTNPIFRGMGGLAELIPPFLTDFKRHVCPRVMVVAPSGLKASFPDEVVVVEHPEPLRAGQVPGLASKVGFELASDETVIISFESLWVDPIAEELRRFESGSRDAALVYVQPGVQFALFRLQGLLKRRAKRLSHLEADLRTANALGEADFVRLRQPGCELYLCVDHLESREFLLDARRHGKSREHWSRPAKLRIFPVQNYRKLQSFIRKLNALKPLEGKRILEVGASTTQSTIADVLFKEFEIKSYTGINIEEFSYKLDYPRSKLLTLDIHQFQPVDRYDIVFSFAAWEHICDPLPLIHKIPGWLAMGGVHYGIFFCWSGATGHHITREREGSHLVSFFDHLRLSEPQLRAKLEAANLSEGAIEDIAYRIYESGYINRVRAKDFMKALMTCGLEVVYLDLRNGGHFHPWLKDRPEGVPGYSNEELSINGFEFLLRRSAFDWRQVLDRSEFDEIVQAKVSY